MYPTMYANMAIAKPEPEVKHIHESVSFEDTIAMAKASPNHAEIMNDLMHELCLYFDEVKEKDEHGYDVLMDNLLAVVNGPHFNKFSAHEAVEHMKNMDGTTGEHWTLEETTAVAKQHKLTFDTFNEYDFYYVLNMMYSDYFDIFKGDTETYVQLTIAWLMDPDVPEGKSWRYYKKVVNI